MTRKLLVACLKMLCLGTLLRNPVLDIDKYLKKYKQIVFLLIVSALYESNLQYAKTVISNMWDKLNINFLYVGLHTDRIGTNLNLKKIMTKPPY